MKKFLSILLVAVMLLGVLPVVASAEGITYDYGKSMNVTLFDQGGVKLVLTGCEYTEYLDSELVFNVQVTNNTNKMINLNIDNAFCDYEAVDGIGIYDVAAGESKPEYFFFMPSVEGSRKLNNVNVVSFNVRVTDDATRDKIFVTDTFTLTRAGASVSAPSVSADATYDYDKSMNVTLFDQGGVKLVLTGCEYTEYLDSELVFNVQVTNNSGKMINLNIDNAFCNGKPVDGIGIYDVANGESKPEYFFFMPATEGSWKLNNVDTVSFNVRVTDDATRDKLFVTDTFNLVRSGASVSAPSASSASSAMTYDYGKSMNVVLFEQGGVKLVATGVRYTEYLDSEMVFDVKVTNNTGKMINLNFDNCYANGKAVDGIGIYDVANGEQNMTEYFFFMPMEEGSWDLNNVNSVSFNVRVTDDATRNVLFTTDTISLTRD